MARGPLDGIRIVEIAGLGPTPFAAMTLADMGAEVIRIDRPGAEHLLGLRHDILNRGRAFVELDLKDRSGRATARRLIAAADALIEGLRPGAMERLGLGPADFPDNPRLVYGRMTGWGQTGPLARTAGHDITYLALTGALHAIGPEDQPLPPLNLVGDFGGGAMYLAFGMVCALREAERGGKGQVVDAAITDGTLHLLSMIRAMQDEGQWQDRRGANLLDGGVPWYATYRCRCGGFVAVGAIEDRFYAALLDGLGLAPQSLPPRSERAAWPALRARLSDVFLTRDRDEWGAQFAQTDACCAPVLTLAEAALHPQIVARGALLRHDDRLQPAPQPVLSRTPGRIATASQHQPVDAAAILARWET